MLQVRICDCIYLALYPSCIGRKMEPYSLLVHALAFPEIQGIHKLPLDTLAIEGPLVPSLLKGNCQPL